ARGDPLAARRGADRLRGIERLCPRRAVLAAVRRLLPGLAVLRRLRRHGGDRRPGGVRGAGEGGRAALPALRLPRGPRGFRAARLAALVRTVTMKAAGVRSRKLFPKLASLALIVAAVVLGLYVLHRRSAAPTTNDATIDADVVHVAAAVG